MSELKPCPFCGGEAKTINHPASWNKNILVAYVRCETCQVNGTPFELNTNHTYKDGAEYIYKAIEAWNRRATDGC